MGHERAGARQRYRSRGRGSAGALTRPRLCSYPVHTRIEVPTGRPGAWPSAPHPQPFPRKQRGEGSPSSAPGQPKRSRILPSPHAQRAGRAGGGATRGMRWEQLKRTPPRLAVSRAPSQPQRQGLVNPRLEKRKAPTRAAVASRSGLHLHAHASCRGATCQFDEAAHVSQPARQTCRANSGRATLASITREQASPRRRTSCGCCSDFSRPCRDRRQFMVPGARAGVGAIPSPPVSRAGGQCPTHPPPRPSSTGTATAAAPRLVRARG